MSRPSTLTWLDYSEAERRRMTEAINLFRDRSILDELGLGSIRDWAISDLFFPGLSTVQTRARYFLFIPWMYLDIERSPTAAKDPAARFRALHTELVVALERGGAKDGGVVGLQTRERTKILAHRFYWRGLGLYKIRRFDGTIDRYESSIERARRLREEAPRFEPGEFVSAGQSGGWDPGIPSAPEKYLRKTDFQLSVAESEYLKNRMVQAAPNSLLAHLLDRNEPLTGINRPWLHPRLGEFPSLLREQLEHARLFAEITQGAIGLYRLMLAEAKKEQRLIDSYSEALKQWGESVTHSRQSIESWDVEAFWQLVRSVNPNIPTSAELFVRRWTTLTIELGRGVTTSDAARSLVTRRELQLKRSLARLTYKPALDTWSGAPVAEPFSFRWSQARTILSDVLEPLTSRKGRVVADA